MFKITKLLNCTSKFGSSGACNHGGIIGRMCRSPGLERDHQWTSLSPAQSPCSPQEQDVSYQTIRWCCGSSWSMTTGMVNPTSHHALLYLEICPLILCLWGSLSYSEKWCHSKRKWGCPNVPSAHWWGLNMFAGAESLNPSSLCPKKTSYSAEKHIPVSATQWIWDCSHKNMQSTKKIPIKNNNAELKAHWRAEAVLLGPWILLWTWKIFECLFMPFFNIFSLISVCILQMSLWLLWFLLDSLIPQRGHIWVILFYTELIQSGYFCAEYRAFSNLSFTNDKENAAMFLTIVTGTNLTPCHDLLTPYVWTVWENQGIPEALVCTDNH